jgi:diguanylate cyclase (GGDEF)-like protein
MMNPEERLEILAIGLDSFSIEAIKKALKENGLKYYISFLQDVSELETYNKKAVEAVFFFSNRQSQKTIQDIRKISLTFPRSAITLLSPRADQQGIIGAFRAGLFDFLTLPIDEHEIRTIIYRLQLHEVIQSGMWNPERAVLHLFSKPENFAAIEDIAASLNQYLNLFFHIEKNVLYSSQTEMMTAIEKLFKLSEHQHKRIKRFLNDPSGLIFGLRFFKDKFHFLVKTGENKFSYLVAKNTSDFQIHEILSDYLSNVLKTSLSILSESKRINQMQLLSLTDEVTGLFNQRKLVEDLEYHIARYPHDKEAFTLLFVDIDYFKNVNDQFGHVVGSRLLVDMAAVLKTQLRGTDLVYRYGGDEFIVLLPKSSIEESKRIAVRISEAVKEAEFAIDHETKTYRLSLSIGIAEFPTDADSAKSIIEFADKMMYMSKKSGRGKVFHVTEVVA